MSHAYSWSHTPGSSSGNYFKDAIDRHRDDEEQRELEIENEWRPICKRLSGRWNSMTLAERMQEVETNEYICDYDNGTAMVARWFMNDVDDFLNDIFPLGEIGTFEEIDEHNEEAQSC